MKNTEEGIIDAAEVVFDADHGVHLLSVGIMFGSVHQGMGGIVVTPEIGLDCLLELAEVCGVLIDRPAYRDKKALIVKPLVGEEVTAYRCFTDFNAPIEALRSHRTRKLFNFRAWRCKHWPSKTEISPLAERKKDYQERVDHAQWNLERAKKALANFREGYAPIPSK